MFKAKFHVSCGLQCNSAILLDIDWNFATEDNASTTGLMDRYYMPAHEDFPPVPTFSFINLALMKYTTEMKKSAFVFYKHYSRFF